MSASSIPTLRPRSRKPSARLTAVVDLPTPPLPEATAMMAPTPGTAGRRSPAWAAGRPWPACGEGWTCGRAPPAGRSPVRATSAEATPGMARTAVSAALRTGSQLCTTVASTVIEKNTLPSVTTMSDSLPVLGSGVPSGPGTAARAARTSSLLTAMSTAPLTGHAPRPHSTQHRQAGRRVNADSWRAAQRATPAVGGRGLAVDADLPPVAVSGETIEGAQAAQPRGQEDRV